MMNGKRTYRLSVAAALVLAPISVTRAQNQINPPEPDSSVIVPTTDLAILESPEDRTDLDCRMTPEKTEIGFDLRFHAGYQAEVGLPELATCGDELRIVLRVTSLRFRDQSYYFQDWVRVPLLHPWRDAIAGAVKAYHGLAFSVTEPRDLARALRDMTARIDNHECVALFHASLPAYDHSIGGTAATPGAWTPALVWQASLATVPARWTLPCLRLSTPSVCFTPPIVPSPVPPCPPWRTGFWGRQSAGSPCPESP